MSMGVRVARGWHGWAACKFRFAGMQLKSIAHDGRHSKIANMFGRRIERGTALGGSKGRGGEGRMRWKPVGIAVGYYASNEGGRAKGKGRYHQPRRHHERCAAPWAMRFSACWVKTARHMQEGGAKACPKMPQYAD